MVVRRGVGQRGTGSGQSGQLGGKAQLLVVGDFFPRGEALILRSPTSLSVGRFLASTPSAEAEAGFILALTQERM